MERREPFGSEHRLPGTTGQPGTTSITPLVRALACCSAPVAWWPTGRATRLVPSRTKLFGASCGW